MSLVGNLEDLSLGDIMQIISLSQKTGVLQLNSAANGSGRIVFRSGLICAASLAGRSEPTGAPAELEAEVEAIVLNMFTWQGGDFSFDLRREADPEDPQFELAGGLNAQYLAMEGMRVRDEASRAQAAEAPAAPPQAEATSAPAPAPATPTAEVSAGEAMPAAVDAEDPFADWTFGEDEDEEEELATVIASPEPADPVAPPAASVAPTAAAPAAAEEKDSPPAAQKSMRTRPLVLIDADAVFVGWAKEAFQTAFAQVHVFQQADQGLARIRQYLIRGQFPIVLISNGIEIDPLCGIHGVADFVKRLKTQAPRLPIYCLIETAEEEGAPTPRPTAAFDGQILRPGRNQLQEWTRAGQTGSAAQLVEQLVTQLGERASGPTG